MKDLHVWDVECLECGIFGLWDVGDVGCWDGGCLRCGMFGMWDVWDVGCWECSMLGIWDVGDVKCSGCEIFGNVQVVEGCLCRICKIHNGQVVFIIT